MATQSFETTDPQAQTLPVQPTPQRLVQMTSRIATAAGFLLFLVYWRQTGGW